MNKLYSVYKQVQKINKLFAQNLDSVAMKLCKQLIPEAEAIGYSLILDTESRLVLLEKIVGDKKVIVSAVLENSDNTNSSSEERRP